MADLLPSIPDASVPEDAEPRVVGLEDEAAGDVLGALSSTTARELFAAINDDPAHPAALAERVDTSLQNVQYHLGKLEDAGMVEVVDTAYSAKGREMDVYAPADRPLVVFAGDEEDQTLLDRALGRLLGGVGVLAGASLAVRGLAGAEESGNAAERTELTSASTETEGDGAAGADGSGDAVDSGSEFASSDDLVVEVDAAPRQVDPLAQDLAWVAEPLDATGLPPGLALFLLGGALLAVAAGAQYWRMRQTAV